MINFQSGHTHIASTQMKKTKHSLGRQVEAAAEERGHRSLSIEMNTSVLSAEIILAH